MSLEPAQPGEPLLPKMTAEWYNNTLPQRKGAKGVGQVRERIEAMGFLTTGSVARFGPAGISGILDDEAYTEVGAKLNATPTADNWVVAQAAMDAGDTAPVVFSGLTYAAVTAGTGNKVDLVGGVLTQSTEGKAVLLHYASPYSLISLGGGSGSSVQPVIFGTVDANFVEGDATFGVTVTAVVEGTTSVTSITVQNRYNWAGTAGDDIEAFQSKYDSLWYPRQKDC